MTFTNEELAVIQTALDLSKRTTYYNLGPISGHRLIGQINKLNERITTHLNDGPITVRMPENEDS